MYFSDHWIEKWATQKESRNFHPFKVVEKVISPFIFGRKSKLEGWKYKDETHFAASLPAFKMQKMYFSDLCMGPTWLIFTFSSSIFLLLKWKLAIFAPKKLWGKYFFILKGIVCEREERKDESFSSFTSAERKSKVPQSSPRIHPWEVLKNTNRQI